MFAHASRVASLLTSVAILLVGHGLQLSLLPLRAQAMGWSSAVIGLSGSCYFAGLLLGCFTVPALVKASGHIRIFTVLTSVMTAALLCLSLLDHVWSWLALRMTIGWSIAGLYLVVESWLNGQVDNEERGSLLSLYTTTVLLAMATGQLLLNVAVPGSDRVLVLSALCVVLAAVPIGLTRMTQPDPIPAARFSPLGVLRTSRAATVSAFTSGMVTGSFYALGPIYGQQMNLGVAAISFMMGAGILGGALFQWPFGRASDRMDRRRVIVVAMLLAVGVSLVILVTSSKYLPALVFLFGGCVMPIYALSLAHAGDNVKGSFLEVGTGILIVNAVGASLGPILVAILMGTWGASSFFGFCAAVLGMGALANVVFIARRPALRPAFSPFEFATSASAQGAIELDPRSDEGHQTRSPPL